MLLKLKAKFYQYTGIYLAKKEEQKHIKSLKLDINDTFREGMAIGIWQCNNGFARQLILNKKYYRPRSFKRRIQNFINSCIVGKRHFVSDMKYLYGRLFK